MTPEHAQKQHRFAAKTLWPGSTQLAPVPAVLVGCGDGSAQCPYNLLTVAWAGVVNSDPAMLSISVRKERYSYALLQKTGVFTVNLPSRALAADLDWCGVVSGRDHDKFAERHLTPVCGSKVPAPVVAEAPLALECRVTQTLDLGSHTLFLAEIAAVQAAEVLLDETGRLDLDRAGLVAYAHGHYYELGKAIGHFGYSVRKKGGPRVRTAPPGKGKQK